MLHVYRAWNGPRPTSAAVAAVTTNTTIQTMQQLATPSTRLIKILAWGYSCDDPPGADAVFELIKADTAATVTAYATADLQPVPAGVPASLLTVGVSASGYTSTSETAPTVTKVIDAISVSSVSAEAAAAMKYVQRWDWDAAQVIEVSSFVRVRATTPTTGVGFRSWIEWCE